MTINILGVDLEMDIYDVDVYEKYEDAVRMVNHKVNELPDEKAMNAAGKLRHQCGVVKEFFDTVFGPGTADALFHGKNNIKDCTEAYLGVIEATREAMEAYSGTFNAKAAELRKKYAPEVDQGSIRQFVPPKNRSQRRRSGKKRNS